MQGMIRWWAGNPVAANLLMFFLVVGGVVAFFSLERETFPPIQASQAEVAVFWPGAAPQEVEEQIVIKIEEALNDLDGVVEVRSVAREGMGFVTVEFSSDQDRGDFINKVKLRVDTITSFPRDAYPPEVRETVYRDNVFSFALYGNVDERLLKSTAEQLRDELAALPHVSIVDLNAVRAPEIAIELSEESMRRYGLTFDEVSRAIRASSINLSSGVVRSEAGDISMRARNLADSEADFANIVVRQTQGGATVRLGDVATIIDGFEESDFRVSLNGSRAALIEVMTTDVMDIVAMKNAIEPWFQEAKDDVPAGLTLIKWWDGHDFMYEPRIGLVVGNAALGLGLVLIILFLFLRPAVALWTAIGIAIAFAGGFIFLPFLGVSLNMLSLFGVLLVIGIVVDDAIIVGEAIHAQTERGEQGLDAAVKGAHLVSSPVVFAVATSMIAFFPWLFMSGDTPQFTRNLSWVIICALAISLIESLFILPAHLAHLKPLEGRRNPLLKLQRWVADSMVWFARAVYRPLITLAIRMRYVTAVFFFSVFAVAISVVQLGYVRTSFMPDIENEMIFMRVELPDGVPDREVDAIFERLQAAGEALNERNGSPGAPAEHVSNVFTATWGGDVVNWFQLYPLEERGVSAGDIADGLVKVIGDIPLALNIEYNYKIGGSGPDFQLAVNSRDLDQLRAAVADLKSEISTYTGVSNVRDNMQAPHDEIQFDLMPGADKLGLPLAEVSRQVRQAYYGEEIQRLPREGEDVRVMLRYPRETRESLDSLDEFRVRTADGREVPLASVAEQRFEPSLNSIRRLQGQRTATIQADLTEDASFWRIKEQLDESGFMDEWKARYPGVTTGVLGSQEDERQFNFEILVALGVVMAGIYAMTAAALRSYFQPFMIIAAIPFGLLGSIVGHYVFNESMSMFSMFGTMAAVGVVVNDNLVLTDYIKRLRDAGQGAYQALVEAGVTRFRPIILTSLTTFVGLMPIMAEQDLGARFLQGAVIALAFGILFATTITLVLVPALYAIGVDIARFFRGLWTGQPQPGIGHDKSDWEAIRHAGERALPAE